eukprot:TRINITY_DN45367_c0_g1_i1.p1 TRINITY_DN45367_c0_g1~~TRINITY_DN45367_c0_g1_i1.p1  ORF type:complete len:480 (-),score=91.72 TRINITY_DN45367_c0_g1_i1:10-1311(-)
MAAPEWKGPDEDDDADEDGGGWALTSTTNGWLPASARPTSISAEAEEEVQGHGIAPSPPPAVPGEASRANAAVVPMRVTRLLTDPSSWAPKPSLSVPPPPARPRRISNSVSSAAAAVLSSSISAPALPGSGQSAFEVPRSLGRLVGSGPSPSGLRENRRGIQHQQMMEMRERNSRRESEATPSAASADRVFAELEEALGHAVLQRAAHGQQKHQRREDGRLGAAAASASPAAAGAGSASAPALPLAATSSLAGRVGHERERPRDARWRVELRIAERNAAGFDTTWKADTMKRVPMTKVRVQGHGGVEELEVVDLQGLRDRCIGIGQAVTANRLLEEGRHRERSRRWAAAARASLEDRLGAAREAGRELPSSLSYEERRDRALRRKLASESGVLLQKMSGLRGGNPHASDIVQQAQRRLRGALNGEPLLEDEEC